MRLKDSEDRPGYIVLCLAAAVAAWAAWAFLGLLLD